MAMSMNLFKECKQGMKQDWKRPLVRPAFIDTELVWDAITRSVHDKYNCITVTLIVNNMVYPVNLVYL